MMSRSRSKCKQHDAATVNNMMNKAAAQCNVIPETGGLGFPGSAVFCSLELELLEDDDELDDELLDDDDELDDEEWDDDELLLELLELLKCIHVRQYAAMRMCIRQVRL